jgi:hypothetical protein
MMIILIYDDLIKVWKGFEDNLIYTPEYFVWDEG